MIALPHPASRSALSPLARAKADLLAIVAWLEYRWPGRILGGACEWNWGHPTGAVGAVCILGIDPERVLDPDLSRRADEVVRALGWPPPVSDDLGVVAIPRSQGLSAHARLLAVARIDAALVQA